MEEIVVAEKCLSDAAAKGDITCLNTLLEKDPFLLDRVSYTCPNKTPLHIATTKGHLDFVREILLLNPQLAKQLDSQQSSPLHIASAKGHVEIVRLLLLAAPGMCLSRDCQGRNPLHLAVINGAHNDVLKALVQKVPRAARQKVDQHQTVLHLCVIHGRTEALKMLVPYLNDLLDAKDDDGDTILHMAVRDKQLEIILRLLDNTCKIDLNAENSKGQTSMDILEQISTYENSNIERRLRAQIRSNPNNTERVKWLARSNSNNTERVKWLRRKGDTIMVVAVLIATMVFQAAVTPPGGVWQEDSTHDLNGNPLMKPHRAGEAVASSTHPQAYNDFIHANTVSFLSSLAIILLLVSGLPFVG